MYNIFNNNQRGITLKLRKGGQSFLYCIDLFHIPIKFHENMFNGY